MHRLRGDEAIVAAWGKKCIQAFGWMLISSAVMAEEKVLHIAADPWCPYNCEPGAENQGFMVDIAKEALALSGYTLDYEVINWARAKKMVQAGKLDGIFGMAKTERSRSLYRFPKSPLGVSSICFFTRADSDWRYESVDSLSQVSIGWINGYGMGNDDQLNAWFVDNKGSSQVTTFAGQDVHERLYQALLAKRIDTFPEDFSVIAYSLRQNKLADEISVSGCSAVYDHVYLVFSLKNEQSEEWAAALDRGFEVLLENGRLAAILQNYGQSLESWPLQEAVAAQ